MSYSFKIWIDADSCPKEVRNFIIDYAKLKDLTVYFVANRDISHPKNDSRFSMIICEKTEGSTDNYILSNATTKDIVITRDIPFAEKLTQLQITVMNDRGFLFTKDNIKEKLSERNFNLNLSFLGLNEGKKNSYGQKEYKKFTDTFDKIISQMIVNEIYSKKSN